MKIGLREWLIIIIAIIIVAIIFNIWRCMCSGKGKLKFRLKRNLSNLSTDSSTELLLPACALDTHIKPQLDEHDLPSLSASVREVCKPSFKHKNRYGIQVTKSHNGNFNLYVNESLNLNGQNSTFYDENVSKQAAMPRQSVNTQSITEEVLVISVISRDAAGFKGPVLLQNILESGLRFGKMNIFHCHENISGNSKVLFSMANAVKPGTFDLNDIDLFSTPAVSFFLGLPSSCHPKQAFNMMVAAARKLSQELNGELKDDQRSVMTVQTIEHYRQRIVEFERRALTQKR
ncbi:cell division protein ZipA [Candidatus Pseudomonas adelgestsugas]|uniref:Cell division protein ZipA n=1 Tax=Candidatus Pseudomonas adelgestsugas TaxID=1302376 RepID=A0ABX5RA08_9PSED|nr:cell division protein ZipA [Candidatus Pseudomonas adelgestsugas]QAX82169.1 Cell division protein ZipA [Candidatus Pseudomonas adelgestsugas]